MTVFVPNGPSRKDTAILLVGTAQENDLPTRDIKVKPNGFFITDDLAALIGGTPIDLGENAPADPDANPDADPDADEDEDDVPPYEEWEYADLKTEVATRGVEVEDQKKETLIAALHADDEAQAE